MKVLTNGHDIWQGERNGSYSGYTADQLRSDLEELNTLRSRAMQMQELIADLNKENDSANGNDAELWNVHGEFQSRVDTVLKSDFLKLD